MKKKKLGKELVVEAKNENLDIVQDFIAEELEASGCSMKVKTQISLVVEEIFVNIAHYAYVQDEKTEPKIEQTTAQVGSATVRIVAGCEIVIEFEDNGKPYNPLEKDDPDVTLSAEERELGGLGVFIVKNLMDVVKYRYENNKNILTIKKVLEDIIA